jgi:alpha-amylase
MQFLPLIFLFLAALILPYTSAGHSKEEWKSRTVYQLLTDRFARPNGDDSPCNDIRRYCGGTWKGITNNLDYIHGMGFDAIWISPIIDNTPNGYHGYWAKNWESLNEFFGDESSLKELVDECHKRDIWVMIDVVANHVGPVNNDYSSIKPFNSPNHYHDFCSIEQSDYDNNQWRVENCRLSGLPDLSQENPFVRQYLLKWIKNMVKKYQFDGIRIDTVAHVPKDFWTEFRMSARAFTLGEVFNGRIDFVKGYMGPLDGVLNYPMFFAFRDFFRKSNFGNLWITYSQVEQAFGKELDYMGIFIDNHDNPRLRHYITPDVSRASIALILLSRGIPIIYYGTEQDFDGENDPNNREPLWTRMDKSNKNYEFVKTFIKFRKDMKLWQTGYRQIIYENHLYAVQRNHIIAIVTSIEGAQSREINNVEFADGTKLCNYLNPKDCVVVLNKKIYINLAPSEMVKLYVKEDQISVSSHIVTSTN